MKNFKKFALITVTGGALLQFGGCFGPILAGIASGFGISIISQLLPLSVTQSAGGGLF